MTTEPCQQERLLGQANLEDTAMMSNECSIEKTDGFR